MTSENDGDRPRIGISACLLGDEVRFDGGHKRDPFLTDVLSPHVEWVRVCPEVEVGMGTPREALRLVRDRDGRIRMVTTRTGIDHTDAMDAWSRGRLRALAGDDLSGYVLKKNSPSCGMERVKVFSGSGGAPGRNGRGLFAEALIARFPNLPIEEEGRLTDPGLRENFIERVFAYHRLRRFFDGHWTRGGLVAFHTAHKMSLLSHSPVAYAALGRLVASPPSRAQLRDRYEGAFMETMAVLATPKRHTNVLLHMAGHLKTLLDKPSKDELLACIEDYRRGIVPLIVPVTLLRHHVRRHGVEYLTGQTYLEPHPRELRLRNRV